VTEETFAASTPDGPIAGHAGGSGAPLLLLHGGPALSDYMDMLGPELDGWRWVRYQQRGRRMQVSVAAYAGTSASAAEHLASGFGEKLGGVRAPAVFVLGERSPMPVSQGEQTAALLPSAEVHVIPGAGHLPWHEQPGCVAAALAAVRTQAGVA